jgi:acyl-coenzyme A synthetase/AMP-(fatty) acid ligase
LPDSLSPRFGSVNARASEAPLFITHQCAEDPHRRWRGQRPLARGRPSEDCEVRFLDDDGNDVPLGDGEIAPRAPFQMRGYLDDDELTTTFLPGGFMRTRGVEDVLAAHPKVRGVPVVGIPNEKWGEAIAGFVALRPASPPSPARGLPATRPATRARLTRKTLAPVSGCRAAPCRG